MYKVAHYRRALWAADGGSTLEKILNLCLGNCPDVSSTKFEYKSDTDVQISERSLSAGGTALYFTLYSEGRKAATVANGGPGVGRHKAPTGQEFLRTGIHLVVEGNHVGYLADGHTNDGQITGLFQRFIEHAKRPKSETQFHLHPRADRQQIEKLLKAGVKSIDLGISAFETTVNDINHEVTKGSLSAAIGSILAPLAQLGAKGRSPEEMLAASEIQTSIHLGYDGRSAGHLVPFLLAKIADGITDTEDEFKIVTRDDNVITRTKLVIRREVSVEGDEIAIDTASAFSAIRSAMKEWRSAGIFEQ